MAKKAIISTETLNAIGQAIIEKGGATSPMYPKDMPTAIRSIQGSGEGRIPSGGTKGQVLSKKSNADFDLEWKTGGDMRHDEFDALKLVDDLNPENTGITQICSLLNQIKNLLKPVCIATLVSLFTFSGFSAYVETNKLVNLIGKSNVVTGVSFDGLLTGINTNGHPVSVSGGIADIVLPECGESGVTTNAVKDIASSAAITNAGAVAYADYEKRGKLDMSVYYLQYGDWTDSVGDTYTFFSKVDNVVTWKHGSNDFIEETLGVPAGARWYMMKNGRTARVYDTYSEDALEVWMSNTGGDFWILTRPYYVRRVVKDNDSLATEVTAKGIASSAAVTNAGAVASAKAYADGTFAPKVEGGYLPLSAGDMYSLTGDLWIYCDERTAQDSHRIVFTTDKYPSYIKATEKNAIGQSKFTFGMEGDEDYDSSLTPDGTPVVTSNMLNGVLTPALAQKADRASPATANNFAALTAQGNLADSGKKAADFAPSVEGGYLPRSAGSDYPLIGDLYFSNTRRIEQWAGEFAFIIDESDICFTFQKGSMLSWFYPDDTPVMTEGTSDYALVNIVTTSTTLTSGQIGSANMTADLSVTLDFSDNNRSGDCLLYLTNATQNDFDIIPTQSNNWTFVSTDLAKALTIGKATTNIVTFTRLAKSGNASTILVSKQEVK